jgi:hypothetical protein
MVWQLMPGKAQDVGVGADGTGVVRYRLPASCPRRAAQAAEATVLAKFSPLRVYARRRYQARRSW